MTSEFLFITLSTFIAGNIACSVLLFNRLEFCLFELANFQDSMTQTSVYLQQWTGRRQRRASIATRLLQENFNSSTSSPTTATETTATEMLRLTMTSSFTGRKESQRCSTCKTNWFQPNFDRQKRRRTMILKLTSEVSKKPRLIHILFCFLFTRFYIFACFPLFRSCHTPRRLIAHNHRRRPRRSPQQSGRRSTTTELCR